MAINPITYTEKITRSFLRYQLTAYPFADERLYRQMRNLLDLDRVRYTTLQHGPFISLSRSFRQGPPVKEMVTQDVFHPHISQMVGSRISHLHGHQEKAFKAIHAGKTTLISTGTGSGKTECFLYPIISRCLELRDAEAPAGISAVIVYPMNSLAEDQLERLRGLLAGSGITFGMYIGKTPSSEREVGGHRLKKGSTRADYEEVLKKYRERGEPDVVHPPEEVCSREIMRKAGCQPRILLTNVKQLELLLTRQMDVELFDNARLDYLVFDEAHTFTGINGAETACLIRRLRQFCNTETSKTVCIAASATIADQRDPDAGKRFASRFFGVSPKQVECVYEEYETETWPEKRNKPTLQTQNVSDLLAQTLTTVEKEDADQTIRDIYKQLTGLLIEEGPWRETLYEALVHNELAFMIHLTLHHPMPLDTLIRQLEKRVERKVSEEELLTYLALGAAAYKEGRPVFRPVVHTFLRGIPGGVVTFPDGNELKLWLSREDEIHTDGGKDGMWRLPVYTCTTCGQHYFVTYLKDFNFTGKTPEGGQIAENGNTYWEALNKENNGKRVVLIDRTIGQDDDEDLEKEKWSSLLYFCRFCGTAHEKESERCQQCSAPSPPVQLYAVKSNPNNPGYLSSCVSCTSRGRPYGQWYREPCREVRAVNVSDVHVIAQDMVHHAERQRLLLFADNRQDAAFQAGWMKDHARRFRLRRLMADVMQDNPIPIGDMVAKLNDILDQDDALSQVLIPEVWQVALKEGSGGDHEKNRKYFLRIQVLREVTTAANQQLGLEPWGRMKISYDGLESGSKFIQDWSRRLGLPPEDLKNGIETLLDQFRRQRLLYDPFHEIFTRWWSEGDREILNGYMPMPLGPKAMKLRLEEGDNRGFIKGWLSERTTHVRQVTQKWGVPAELSMEFVEALWNYLRSEAVAIIVPVRLKNQKLKPLPNCQGAYQIAAGKVRISENHGYFRCTRCRRKVARRTPFNRCMAWYCDGDLEFIAEDPDNYDLQLLDQGYSMLRPEEHTAMVPTQHREKIENWFKGQTDRVNTLVCTPTLELGVDIGALDSILLRNVPPLPANYWQRAGRAGRRQRMAVTVCYCRPMSHDRAYFDEPLKMLEGKVDPPAFNLRNDVMVAKHVHATVLGRLFQISRVRNGSPEEEGKAIRETLRTMLPTKITSYLFEPDGRLRNIPFDICPMQELIQRYREDLIQYAVSVFQQSWPESDAETTSREALEEYIDRMADEFNEVLVRLRKRLQWAHREIIRLNSIRENFGTLDKEDDSHYKRCDRLIKKLKGKQPSQRSEAEGVDDINTYNVLSAEGFLPSYGLDSGSIIGMAEIPFWQLGSMDFDLPRPPSVALREYVPGNLIYANGHRFMARRFHREADEDRHEMPLFEVNIEREAVLETNTGQNTSSLSGTTLKAISVCDAELVHWSQISDEEEARFQMQVAIYGREKGRHNGGVRYTWGERVLDHRHGVHLRLVNVGSSQHIIKKQELGYPICSVCGQSVSPLASDAQLKKFREGHEERCGRTPSNIGFFADIVADCFTLPECTNRTEVYSILEALRMGAAHVLDMHLEDLQILTIGYVDRDDVDGMLWDPMPGGSGLLEQIRDNFAVVTEAAIMIANECPSGCETSCIDCLQTFRNSYYHKYLNRKIAVEKLTTWGNTLTVAHDIPPSHPSTPSHDPAAQPVNYAETKLKHLLVAAGFTSGTFQKQIRFSQPIVFDHQIGSTTPDVFFAGDEDDEEDKGVAIYLDGMSASLHGDPKTAERDKEIRTWLRNNDYQVIEITVVELDDRDAMIRHFRKLARYLSGKDFAQRINDDPSWFDRGREEGG